MSELQKRLLTGVVGAAGLILLIVYGGVPGVSFLALAISILMMFEFVGTCFKLEDRYQKRTLLFLLAILTHVTSFVFPNYRFETLIGTYLILFVHFLITVKGFEGDRYRAHVNELVFAVFGLIYVVSLPLFLPLIRALDQGVFWTLLFLITVWSADTGAYFAGKKFGKNKLFPAVSPKKTIEGTVGGILTSLIISTGFGWVFIEDVNLPFLIPTVLIVSSLSQVGDLCESLLKRGFDVKDFGSILPGHGGVLDRFDGVVFSLPVMYTLVRLFG